MQRQDQSQAFRGTKAYAGTQSTSHQLYADSLLPLVLPRTRTAGGQHWGHSDHQSPGPEPRAPWEKDPMFSGNGVFPTGKSKQESVREQLRLAWTLGSPCSTLCSSRDTWSQLPGISRPQSLPFFHYKHELFHLQANEVPPDAQWIRHFIE